jgi:hypothetical protein
MLQSSLESLEEAKSELTNATMSLNVECSGLVSAPCLYSQDTRSLQVQHGLLQVSNLDLGLPHPDSPGLWQVAAAEERQEALFGFI